MFHTQTIRDSVDDFENYHFVKIVYEVYPHSGGNDSGLDVIIAKLERQGITHVFNTKIERSGWTSIVTGDGYVYRLGTGE